LLMNALKLSGLSQNLVTLRIGFELLSPGLGSDLHQLVFVGRFSGDYNLAFAVEQPADRALGRNCATVFGDNTADFGSRPIPIIRADFGQEGHTVRTINLVGEIFEIGSFPTASSLFDSPLDVVVGHVGGAAFKQYHAQAWVHVGMGTAQLCRDADFLAELGKD